MKKVLIVIVVFAFVFAMRQTATSESTTASLMEAQGYSHIQLGYCSFSERRCGTPLMSSRYNQYYHYTATNSQGLTEAGQVRVSSNPLFYKQILICPN